MSIEKSRGETSVVQFRPQIENFRQKAVLRMHCRSPWNFSPSQPRYPLGTILEGSTKKGTFSISCGNIWANIIQCVTYQTTLPLPLTQNVRTLCIVRVNWQRCTMQGELLLQTVLTGQISWHDPFQGPRDWVHQYHANLEEKEKYCTCEEWIY